MNIRIVYEKEPNFPATDQHPDCVRYQVGTVFADAIGGEPTQADVDAFLAPSAQSVADASAVTVVKANAVITYLVTHTPAECAAKVQTDVTNLATAKDMLAHFAQALCVLAKDRLR